MITEPLNRTAVNGLSEGIMDPIHDEICCMNGIPAGEGPHPDCPGRLPDGRWAEWPRCSACNGRICQAGELDPPRWTHVALVDAVDCPERHPVPADGPVLSYEQAF